MEKYVEVTNKDKGFDKENSWYMVCQQQVIPYITIKVRSKLATVQWDYISYPPSIDEALFIMHENIKIKVSTIYDRYLSKNTWLSVGHGVISFGNLEVSDARQVAMELFEVISEAVHIAMESPQTEQ